MKLPNVAWINWNRTIGYTMFGVGAMGYLTGILLGGDHWYNITAAISTVVGLSTAIWTEQSEHQAQESRVARIAQKSEAYVRAVTGNIIDGFNPFPLPVDKQVDKYLVDTEIIRRQLLDLIGFNRDEWRKEQLVVAFLDYYLSREELTRRLYMQIEDLSREDAIGLIRKLAVENSTMLGFPEPTAS